MKNKLINLGVCWLNQLENLQPDLVKIQKKLQDIAVEEQLIQSHDLYAWLTVIQALSAMSQKTFGVGAIIVDPQGEVVIHGHNQVFFPYFRSSLHAEMVVLDALEEKRKSPAPPVEYTLYTSLEPCMMCLARIIFSRISTVYFVSKDPHAAIINNQHLPEILAHLKEQQHIAELDCLPQLKALSVAAIKYDVQELVDELGGKMIV